MKDNISNILMEIYKPILKEIFKTDWLTEQYITQYYVTPELVACTLGQRERPELYYGKHREIDESSTVTFRIIR